MECLDKPSNYQRLKVDSVFCSSLQKSISFWSASTLDKLL